MKRLTPAALTLGMFGVLGLLVVGYVAKNLLAVQEKKVVPAMRDIPMAITDISPGTVLTDKHLGLGKIQVDRLSREMLLTNRVIIGRVARIPLKAAEPIKANQLYQPGELPPFDLTPGMRAVTIQVTDNASMVDGMLKPSDHADVLFTAMGGNGPTDSYQGGLTMRLFEGVKILAINRNFTQGAMERGNNTFTLEMTEAQANIIVLARDKGKITLIYNPNGKGNGGVALNNAERVTFNEILGLVPAGKPKDPILTEIFRGAGRSAQYWDERGRWMGARTGNMQTTNDRDRADLVLPPVLGPAPAPAPAARPNTDPVQTPAPTTSAPVPPQDVIDQQRAVPTASLPQVQPN